MTSHDTKNYFSQVPAVAWGVFAVLAGFLVYAFVEVSTLQKDVVSLNTQLASATSTLSQEITDLRTQTVALSNTLFNAQQNIDTVRSQVGGVEQNLGSISGTLGDLQKLAKTDPEFLKKYSKVSFLNENYVPARLTEIPAEYLYSKTKPEQFLTESWPFLKRMMDEAKVNGITLYIKSGYRSFAEQKSLKTLYSVVFGSGSANAFSADQGYSEHQLGTTLDFITSGLDGQLEGFDNTEAYRWLTNNAYRFGFQESYPKGNKFYVFEPWHWRFVGVKLANHLHVTKINFYDMDQRDIDAYLISIFD